jgi:hypothetical protein
VRAQMRGNTTGHAKWKKEQVEENNQYFRFPSVINPATKNNNSKWKQPGGREWRIDVIRDVDGIEDEIIKAFHLSLQSKDENHSESIINLKRVDTQLLSFDRLRGLTFYQ